MKTNRLIRIAGSCIVVFAAVLLAMSSIRAAEGVIPASVLINEPLEVLGVAPLEFGVLTPPSSSEAQWWLDATGGSSLAHYFGDVTSTDPIANDESRGRFQILGPPSTSVNYTVSVTIDFADPQLSLLSVETSQSSPQILDINGQLEVYIGGLLSINPGVATGAHDALITMVANY